MASSNVGGNDDDEGNEGIAERKRIDKIFIIDHHFALN